MDREAAIMACNLLQEAGHEAVFVGGCVRDQLIGVEPKDFDLATSARPEQVLAVLPGASYVDAAQAYGVTLWRGIEIATFRTDIVGAGRHDTQVEYSTSLVADVQRRDLTINALALNPLTGEVIDHVGGRADIEAGVIRFVGDPATRIAEDSVRVLRAVRFASRFGFSYDFATQAALAAAATAVADQHPNRLREDLTKILMTARPGAALRDLYELGLLAQLLPEMLPTVGCTQQPDHHSEGDVFVHTGLVLDNCPLDPVVRWSALLHDIGKPQTWSDAKGKITFYGHAEVGADMAKPILDRLMFSNTDAGVIEWVVRHHMAISNIPNTKSRAKVLAYFNHPAFPLLFEHWRADGLGSIQCDGSTTKKGFAEVEAMWMAHLALPSDQQRPSLKKDLQVHGGTLLEMGATPGPVIGQVLEKMEVEYLDGKFASREQALARAASLLKSMK